MLVMQKDNVPKPQCPAQLPWGTATGVSQDPPQRQPGHIPAGRGALPETQPIALRRMGTEGPGASAAVGLGHKLGPFWQPRYPEPRAQVALTFSTMSSRLLKWCV